jgi:hypothetical protein
LSGVGTEILGWTSSAVLVVTLANQVYTQWREGSARVSPWLFLGNLAASIGFTTYSVLVDNWVFVATNALMIGNALAGYAVLRRHHAR